MQSFYHEFKGVLGADCEVKKLREGSKNRHNLLQGVIQLHLNNTANYIKEIMQNQVNKYNLKQNNIKPRIINNAKI